MTSSTAADGTTGAKQIMEVRYLTTQLTINTLMINQPFPHWDYQQFLSFFSVIHGSNDTALTVNSWIADGPEPAITDLDVVVGAS